MDDVSSDVFLLPCFPSTKEHEARTVCLINEHPHRNWHAITTINREVSPLFMPLSQAAQHHGQVLPKVFLRLAPMPPSPRVCDSCLNRRVS